MVSRVSEHLGVRSRKMINYCHTNIVYSSPRCLCFEYIFAQANCHLNEIANHTTHVCGLSNSDRPSFLHFLELLKMNILAK